MENNKTINPKPVITIGLLNTQGYDMAALSAALITFLIVLIVKQREIGFRHELGPVKLEGLTEFSFETPLARFTFLVGQNWDFHDPDFVKYNAGKLFGGIYIISVLQDKDEFLEEQLGFISSRGISPLLVYLNSGVFNTTLVANEAEIAVCEARVRRILAKLGYLDAALLVSGNLIGALVSGNPDPNAPEYIPIIELIKTMEKYFLDQKRLKTENSG